VSPDFSIAAEWPQIVAANLLEAGPVVRHDPDKLGLVLCVLAACQGARWPACADRNGANGDETATLGHASMNG